jgi:hypothetical protein
VAPCRDGNVNKPITGRQQSMSPFDGRVDVFRTREERPPLTDAVEKLGDEHRARNKRIRVNGCLNQRCVRDSPVESKVARSEPSNLFSTASIQTRLAIA